ncbi:RNA methyltransferase [Sediminibacter sp. Hel_I_10]|uniref:TrmH family RNA methyltransferase n=1 Tax=Sediminibacter sp. Hel_I_10 TaxID=1392490 RepID=UPI00047D80A8|nr:RNA methyltransferase [Sediminibacter sp. Hel_I_10]
MLSKQDIKLIKSLNQKKFRQQHGLFCVEGIKSIQEFLNSHLELHQLYATDAAFSSEYEIITATELQKISSLKSPNKALAVFKIPKNQQSASEGLILMLDDIRDPGNLGTIIRLCDWYGIKDLVCSATTVDCYNPKVVQATMGSLTRVRVSYVDLKAYLEGSNEPVFGTFMDGDTIYTQTLPQNGIVIMGNEANGISKDIEALVTKKLSIPRFGSLQATESLNVATATAIVLSEFKRADL